MPRSIVFGNQNLLVCIDKSYNIRDLYYPYVGMENHLEGHECRIGIWVEGNFSWLESDLWEKNLKYASESLIGESEFENQTINSKMTIKDCVYYKKNIFLREIQVENLSNEDKEYRIFFSHDLQIKGTRIGITAYFDPETKSVIHYLRDRWFLFNGKGDSIGIDGFTIGKTHFGASVGSYKDAEDGYLSGNPIDQGTVDSTIQVNVKVKGKQKGVVKYWFTVGLDSTEVKQLNDFIITKGISNAIEETLAFDRTWVKKSNLDFFDLPDNVVKLLKQSLLLVKSQMDKSGAIIAANDTDIMQFNRDHYSYLWPRDGALVALSLSKAGYAFLTRKFYQLCGKLITSKGFLLHKYNPDGSIGSSWHSWFNKEEGLILAIQEDETALVLYTLGEYYTIYKDMDLLAELYSKFIIPAADFMVEFRDERGLPLPSYDLWEERRGIHAFTTVSVIAGLRSAAKFAEYFGEIKRAKIYRETAEKMKAAMIKYLFDIKLNRFLRTINFQKDGGIIKDTIMDASIYAIFEFDVFSINDPMVQSTMNQVIERLRVKTDVGGIARYENDYYHKVSEDVINVPGNPWYICTLWIAEWYLKNAKEGINSKDNLDRAKDILKWVADHSLSTGVLAEQVNPYTNEPISVSPLTWSHATLILTVLEYLDSFSIFKACPHCGQPLSFKDSFKIKKERH